MDHTRRRLRLALGLAVLSASLLLPAQPASADHSWGGRHWPSDGRGLAVVNQAGDAWNDYIGHTVNKWRRAVAPHATATFPQGPVAIRYESGGPPRCHSPGRGEILVCAWDGFAPGVAGSARLYLDGNGHIQGATVLFDPRYHGDQLMSILCHEVGHALGLDHRSSGQTCMREHVGYTEPDGHDGDQIALNHNHLD
jgi:hypothetical protein